MDYESGKLRKDLENFSFHKSDFIFLFQPHQLRRIVFQHDFDFVGLDAESEQRADEDPHTVDGVHVQHLAEVAADDAAVGTNFFDGPDGFHRIGHRLIQARNHRLAVRADIDAEIAALEEKLTKAHQLKQGMMQELLTGKTRLVESTK